LFEQFFERSIQNTEKLNYNYLGIIRKEYPKWLGWKIIGFYKEQGFDIKDIQDERLDILVRNFYYLKWIKLCYYTKFK